MVVFYRMVLLPKYSETLGGGASQCIIRQIPSPIVWVTSATKEGLIYFRDGKREDKVKSIKIFDFTYIYIYTIHTTPNALNTLYTMYALYTRNAWLAG